MIEDMPFLKGLLTVMHLWQVALLHCSMFLIMMGQLTTAIASEVTARPAGALKSPVPSTLLVSELFDEAILAENIFAVRRRAFAMPEAERYAYLADWVLPAKKYSTIRMSGAFTPTDPAAIVAREYRDATGAGGTLVSRSDAALRPGLSRREHDWQLPNILNKHSL